MAGYINIAVEGCCHGELDKIYETIQDAELKGPKIDLLLVCGDFQCVRNFSDLESVAVPSKYRKLNTFHQYVTGEKIAPVTTIFIGGNHEASNILQSLYYGGFVAPNIYFLGFAGVVWFGGVRIAGLSGIFNNRHYRLGHYEQPPYSPDSIRSVYHVRELEVFRMSLVRQKIDIFLSHDWPNGIWNFGDRHALLRKKKFLEEDMKSGKLGSPPLMHLLNALKPSYWFAAHLHVKFPAIVPHHPTTATATSATGRSQCSSYHGTPTTASAALPFNNSNNSNSNISEAPTMCSESNNEVTRFLSLDKVLPGRDFLQILRVPQQVPDDSRVITHDTSWLAILKKTHSLLSTSNRPVNMPTAFPEISTQDINWIQNRILRVNNSAVIPPLAPQPLTATGNHKIGSAQTDSLLRLLELPHIWTVPCSSSSSGSSSSSNSHLTSNATSAAPPPPPPPPPLPAAASPPAASVTSPSLQGWVAHPGSTHHSIPLATNSTSSRKKRNLSDPNSIDLSDEDEEEVNNNSSDDQIQEDSGDGDFHGENTSEQDAIWNQALAAASTSSLIPPTSFSITNSRNSKDVIDFECVENPVDTHLLNLPIPKFS